jgi:hypothetical protein
MGRKFEPGAVMKRVLVVIACVSLPLALTGCEFFSYIWQHIVGHSYSQVDLPTLENNSSNMSSASIAQGSMPVNSVLGYKTRNGFYGKLRVVSISSSNLTFEFQTYNPDNTIKAQSGSNVTMNGNDYCDLESGTEGGGLSPNDFQWRSSAILYPTSPAVFYVFP